MKLSYRDKVIFICAIVVIILVAGFFLFIKPKYEETNSAKGVLESKKAEQAEIEAKINTLPDLIAQLKSLAESVKETQSYFLMEQDPYLNEQFVYDILKSSGVNVTSMNTDYTVAGQFNEYNVSVKNVNVYDLLIQADLYDELPQKVRDKYNNVNNNGSASVILGVTNLSIGYKDDQQLSDVFKFIDTIAEDERTMSVLSVNSPDASDANSVEDAEGSIQMVLYSLYPLNVDKVMEETDQIEIVPVAAE